MPITIRSFIVEADSLEELEKQIRDVISMFFRGEEMLAVREINQKRFRCEISTLPVLSIAGCPLPKDAMNRNYGPWTLFPNESMSAVDDFLSHINALFKEKEEEWFAELTKDRLEFMGKTGKSRYRISFHELQFILSLFFCREY